MNTGTGLWHADEHVEHDADRRANPTRLQPGGGRRALFHDNAERIYRL